MDEVIRVDGLGKQYLRGTSAEPETLREWIMHPFRTRPRHESFWALRNVSFSIRTGEVVGLMGLNGAGKSTLLKILARLTFPTEGSFTIKGRMVGIFDLRAAFHPQLSGRENVFLNGAVYGHTRATMQERYQQIVDFAEIEPFMNTPVKHYSSGMRSRLAFAIATHIDFDILLLDEIMAVGDIIFRRKCLSKLDELKARGDSTIILVNHQPNTIEQRCSRCLLLENGVLRADGPTPDVLRTYFERADKREPVAADHGTAKARSVEVTGIVCRNAQGDPITTTTSGEPLWIDVVYRAHVPVAGVNIRLFVENEFGRRVTTLFNSASFDVTADRLAGIFRCKLSQLPLRPGMYGIAIQLGAAEQTFYESYSVVKLKVDSTANLPAGFDQPRDVGDLLLDQTWTIEPV